MIICQGWNCWWGKVGDGAAEEHGNAAGFNGVGVG